MVNTAVPYKDLFISYGRRESLGFVARLHQRLKLAGYEAWFDKVNIPDGEDYAARINHGIESAHNFVYIMAPRALCSPYCLIELEYARYLGKRVIPINQMGIFQTDERPLSAGEQTVLHGFYARFSLDNPNIVTTQQVLERSLAVIGRTDWLDGKQQLTDADCQALLAWAQGYENFWHKHEDLGYLQTLTLPQFGKSIDSLASVIERIQLVLERHTDYVLQHTHLLNQALDWANNQFANHYLLVGKERQTAENYLLREFREGEQAPCVPNHLLCDFICEARKNAENRLTDCFVCYAHEDKAIRDGVVRSLARYVITTWRHDKDIDKSKTYAQAIEAGIEGADNVLFFISPASVQSEYCRLELDHALKYNKRIIPLLIMPTQNQAIPTVIRGLQWVDFTDNQNQQDYDSNIADILNIVRQEQQYYEHHKILLVQALRWQCQQQQVAFLLHGHNLENAKTWLRLHQKRSQHAPLELHQTFILTSEAAKGRLRTEVFLSYSRKDGDFARRLNLSLQAAGKTVWFDQESIATGVDFEAELYKGIDGADNFVFVLSPDSVESPYCEDEVNYALSQGKRIFTVLCRAMDPETLPAALRTINWLDFEQTPFEQSFIELIQALDLDRDHAAQHTVLQQRALEWTENQQSTDFLLNNNACEKAEVWQTRAVHEDKAPAPTALQCDYIQQSRAAIMAAQRREKRQQRWILGSVSLGLVVALGLAGFAWIQMIEAEAQKVQAEQEREEANKQTQRALISQSHFLIEKAQLALEKGHTATAMRILLEASPKTSETAPERPWVKEVYDALSQSINRHYQGIFEHEEFVEQAIFSADGTLLLTHAGQFAYVWNAKTRQLTAELKGHKKSITSALFSPDGRRIVTASRDNTARVWDSESGQTLVTFEEHKDAIDTAAFSPDGRHIVTASRDNTARVWDSERGQSLATLAGHQHRVRSAMFSPDGRRILTTSNDNTARVWDSRSGQLLAALVGHTNDVVSAMFSADGQRVVTASNDNTARLWDSHSGKVLATLKGHKDWVNIASFSPDGRRIVTASWDNTARVWDSQSGQPLATLVGHTNDVVSAAFSPDGQRIVTASDDSTARVWDSENGQSLATLIGHKRRVRSAAFSPDGRRIVTASWDNTARMWDSQSGQTLAMLAGHQDWVRSAVFSPDGRRIVTTSWDSTARVWDSQSGQALATLVGHANEVMSAMFSPNGRRIVTASDDTTARVWDSESGQTLATLMGHEEAINIAVFSPDGRRIVTASDDTTARMWGSDRGQMLTTLTGHHEAINTAAFSPDGHRIVTASDDTTAQVWDSESGQTLATLEGHEAAINTAAFSPNGRRIVTTSRDSTARVWDSQRGQTLAMLVGHKYSIVSAMFSPDGRRIVTASDDNTARVWDSESGQPLVTLLGHQDWVGSAAFSPGGRRIVTASRDNTARIWDSHSGQMLVTLKGHRNAINTAVFSPDGRHVVTTSEDKTARLWLNFSIQEEMLEYTKTLMPPYRNIIGAEQLAGYLTCDERRQYFLDFMPRCARVVDKTIRGDSYVGEYDENTGNAHGKGQTQGQNQYIGDFKQGLKHGQGTYIWADGTQWTGVFKDDLAIGIGAMPAIVTEWYRKALNKKDPALAIKHLQIQLKILPEHVDSWLLWGKILAQQNQDTQAIEKFQHALALDTSLDFDPKTQVLQTRAEGGTLD